MIGRCWSRDHGRQFYHVIYGLKPYFGYKIVINGRRELMFEAL